MNATVTDEARARRSYAWKLGAALALLAAACSSGPDRAPQGDSRGEATPSPLKPHKQRPIISAPVGNSNDFVVQVSGANTIASAQGSFPSVSGSLGGSTSYSLQINSNVYPNTNGDIALCNQADVNPANCSACEQFVYDPGRSALFIEYWLFSNDFLFCPPGFTGGPSGFGFKNACYHDSTHYSAPAQPLSALPSMVLTATSSAAGEGLTLNVGGSSIAIPLQGSLLNLSAHWTQSEFNVFGEYNSQGIDLGSSSIEVQQLVTTATPTRNAPTCFSGGTTGETNSLNLNGNCCPFGGDTPGIQFFESASLAVAPPACPAFASSPAALALQSGGYGQTVFTVNGNLVGQTSNAALQPKTCTVSVGAPITAAFDPSGDPVSFSYNVSPSAAPGSATTAFVTCDTDPVGAPGFTPHALPISIINPLLTAPTGLTVVQGSCTSFEATVTDYVSGGISFAMTPATFVGGGTTSIAQSCYTLGCQGYGNANVCAGLTTPPGVYTFDITAGWQEPSGYGYVSNEDTIAVPVTVLACVPETEAVACNAGATYSSCGTVSAGCGTTVNCACSGANTCSNGVCCPAGLTGMGGTCCAPGDTVSNGQCCPPGSNNCTCPKNYQWNPTTQSCQSVCPSGQSWCDCAGECIPQRASCNAICNAQNGGCTAAQAKRGECT